MSMREVKDDLIEIVNAVTNVLQGCNENLITPAQALNELPPKVEQTRSESYSKGHEQGFEAGYQSGAESGNEAAYNAGVAYGRDVQYSEFWDACQENGNRTDYRYSFGGHGWTDETFKPKYDIRPTLANNMFNTSKMTDLKKSFTDAGVVADFSLCTDFTHWITACPSSTFGEINTVSADSLQYLFAQRNYLVYIDKIVLREDGSQTGLANGFTELRELVEVRFEGKFGQSVSFTRSQYLSSDSVDSIIGALMDMTGKTSQKLVLHTSVIERLTNEQALAITSKNWTIE